MNREQKAAVVDRIADDLQESEAVLAVDYRGLTVKQVGELRSSLVDANASFNVVKNTLTERAADKAGAEGLKPLLVGPTALAFVRGDVATAAKVLSTFRRTAGVPEFKGGQMNGETLSVEQIEAIARLPARDMLQAQFVGVLASPITGLVRGLGSMISGLAVALGQIQEKGLVGGSAAPAEEAADTAASEPEGEQPEASEPAASEPEAEQPEASEPASADSAGTPSEAPGDPVAESEAATEDQASTEESQEG